MKRLWSLLIYNTLCITSVIAQLNIATNTVVTLKSNTGSDISIIGSNFNNNGTVSGDGVLTMNGSSQQTITGTGTVGNFKLNNNSGAVINAGDTLKISTSYIPTSGILTTNNGLVLKSSSVSNTAYIATGSASGNYISGNVVIEQFNSARRAFRFFGHPFSSAISLNQFIDNVDITGSGGSSNGFTNTQTNNPSAFWFDITTADTSTAGNNPGWKDFTSANTNTWDKYELLRILIRGAKGQGLTGGNYSPSSVVLDAVGNVNQGTQVITLTKGSNSNFVGCGNPFPSPIDMQSVNKGSNVGANYYIWDATAGAAGAYITNPFSLSYTLPAFSAFFTTVSNTDSIIFEESDKTSIGLGLFKTTTDKNWIELSISDSITKWDRVLINFNDNSLNTIDKFDGKKLYNPGLDFYTISQNGIRLAVDVRPYNNKSSIPLGLTAYNRYNKYVIRVGMFDIQPGTKLILHDKYLNTKQELKAGFEYWFDILADTASQGENRFEINMIGEPTQLITTNNNVNYVRMFPNPALNEVNLAFNISDEKTEIRLINTLGIVLYKQTISRNFITIPLYNLPTGIYMVELKNKKIHFREKLIKR